MRFLTVISLIVLLCLAGWPAPLARAAGGDNYLVQPGDTLLTIAARYGLSVGDLAAANGLAWNAWVYSGQSLIIPNLAPASVPVPTGTEVTYTVQVADTLANIAYRYGVTPEVLQAANGLANVNLIYPGQQLVIPGNAAILAAPVYAQPAPATIIDLSDGDWVEIGPVVAPPDLPVIYSNPAPAPPAVYGGSGEKWIDVNLTNQALVAYEGNQPVFQAVISSGLPQYPTIAGTFSIYVKYPSARMRGGYGADAYDLPNVPYVMYFHKGYGLHGTYWHNNFGVPMSHGCVNLLTTDAEWLYNWAPIGTRVVTHY